MADARFSEESRIRDVLALGEPGRRLLWSHGYDAGDGFADALSQYQSLLEAARAGRLRDLAGLVAELNSQRDAHKK